MFRPRASHALRLLKSNLKIAPHPARVRWLHDVFANSVGVITFDSAPRELRFASAVTLEHSETTLPDYPLEEYAKTYPFRYSDDELPNLALAMANQHPSENVKKWVTQFLDPSGRTGTISLLRAMTLGIREEFVYVRRSEKGVQSPNETLESRKGSCRDFAVLMMEATRALGLAARFVRGYIFVPGMDAGGTKGGGSTHAWMQA